MPNYVSLQQQGFFEPFQALGHSLAAAAGLIQNKQQMDQNAAQFKETHALDQQKAALEQSKFDQTKPLNEAQTGEAQLALRQKRAADILKNHNFGDALRGPLTPTDEARAAFPGQDLGTGELQYNPPDTTGLDPQAAEEAKNTQKWSPVWNKVNLDTTRWDQLSPDLRRFAVAKVNEDAMKAGAGQISDADVASAYRQKQYEKQPRLIDPSMILSSQEQDEQTGAIKNKYVQGDSEGGIATTPEDRLKATQELGKEARGKFDDYHIANAAYETIHNNVAAASKLSGVGGKTAPQDIAIMNSYLATINPKIRLNPGSREDLEKHQGSLPDWAKVKVNRILGGTGSLTEHERHDLMKAAYDNTLAHFNAGQAAAVGTAAQGPAMGAGKMSVDRISPRITPPNDYAAPDHSASAQAPTQKFSSPDEFKAAAIANHWPTGTKAYITDPKTGKQRVATFTQ